MIKRATLLSLVLIGLLTLTSFSGRAAVGSRPGGLLISTPEQFKDEFFAVPCEDADRLQAVQSLFERMGAPADQIKVAHFERSKVDNLVITMPGATAEKIVIGAHYDKVADGCGAIDNWTGIVAIAHLYRSLKDLPLKKTLVFVAFGKEEKGLIGSKAMTAALEKSELAQYCAMINIDSLGMAMPQVADNMSSERLTKVTEELAAKLKLKFGHTSIANADSDSSSFISHQIPGITIHGMSNTWTEFLHSYKDTPENVNTNGVYLGYRLALALVKNIDDEACSAYR